MEHDYYLEYLETQDYYDTFKATTDSIDKALFYLQGNEQADVTLEPEILLQRRLDILKCTIADNTISALIKGKLTIDMLNSLIESASVLH